MYMCTNPWLPQELEHVVDDAINILKIESMAVVLCCRLLDPLPVLSERDSCGRGICPDTRAGALLSIVRFTKHGLLETSLA